MIRFVIDILIETHFLMSERWPVKSWVIECSMNRRGEHASPWVPLPLRVVGPRPPPRCPLLKISLSLTIATMTSLPIDPRSRWPLSMGFSSLPRTLLRDAKAATQTSLLFSKTVSWRSEIELDFWEQRGWQNWPNNHSRTLNIDLLLYALIAFLEFLFQMTAWKPHCHPQISPYLG